MQYGLSGAALASKSSAVVVALPPPSQSQLSHPLPSQAVPTAPIILSEVPSLPPPPSPPPPPSSITHSTATRSKSHDLAHHPSLVYGGTRPLPALPNPPLVASSAVVSAPPNSSSAIAAHSSSSSSSGHRTRAANFSSGFDLGAREFVRHSSLIERPRPVFDFDFSNPTLPSGEHEEYYNAHYNNYTSSSAGSAGTVAPLLASPSNSLPTSAPALNRAVHSLPTTPNVIIKSGVVQTSVQATTHHHSSLSHYSRQTQQQQQQPHSVQAHSSASTFLPMRSVYSRHPSHYPPSTAPVSQQSQAQHFTGHYGSSVPYSAPAHSLPSYQTHYQQPPSHPPYSTGGHYRYGGKPTPVLMSQTHPVYGSTISAPTSCSSVVQQQQQPPPPSVGGGVPACTTDSPGASSYHRPSSRRETASLAACPNGPGPPTGGVGPPAATQLQPPPPGAKPRPSLRMPFMPWSRPGGPGSIGGGGQSAVNTRLIEPPNGHYQNGTPSAMINGHHHHHRSGIQPLMKLSTLVIVLLAVLIIGFIVLSPLFHYLM